MESEDFVLLLHLARKGGISGQFETSTSKVARELSTSQQTISRKVRQLAAQQLIESRASPNGIEVSFTEKGRKVLNEKYLELQAIFSAKKVSGIEGKVVSGKGKGKYFLSFEQYAGKINEKIGFKPFLGTLNLQVEQSKLEQFLDFRRFAGANNREIKFFGIKCFFRDPLHVSGCHAIYGLEGLLRL